MAPEQTESTAAKVGPWTDIFLLGGILYLVLTGTHPHPQPASAAAFMHAAHGFVEPPEERAPGAEIPGELGAVCMRALSRDPAQRHASALEFADEIDRYLWGANRRAESRAATDAARALLAEARGEYAPLEAADQHLQKALGLWGENPGALELQDRLFAEYADAALSRGDLRLAGVQAQRIAGLQRRESQVRRVEAAVHNARRQTSRRRAAIVASILLSLLAAGLGAGIAVQVLRHRATQALQKTIQVEAREVSRTQELRAGLSNRERDRQQRIGRMREAAARFTEIAARDLPAPTHLEAAKDWAPAFLTANAPFEQSLAALESQAESERAALQAERVALEPPPYRYLLSRGYLGLARNTTDSIRLARELLTSASLQQPLRHEPVAATGVAEARLGDLDAADRILRKAQDLYSRQGRFYDDVRGLACDLDMLRWKRLPRRPGDLVVEASARGGQNRSHVRIISGRWLDNPASSQYKSTAPWLTSRDDASTTACIFYQPLIAMETSSPAVARFLPLAGRPVRYHVYVTWPSEANATPVHYRIRHADGDTTLALVQDGLGIAGESNANAWVALGEYEFLPGEDQFVELSVGEEVRPLTPFRFGQANADAVLFAAGKLDIAAREPDLARDAPPEPAAGAMPAGPAQPDWSTEYETASERARAEGRVLVAYVHYPVSAHLVHPVTRGREYCENRLFPHPDVALEMLRSCVAVRVNRMRRPDVAARLGVADTETAVCIVARDGTVLDRITGDDILMAPIDFAARLRRAVAAAGIVAP
jgi:hypothetical protein